MPPFALSIVFAVAGAAVGFAADRLAARWPEHEDGAIRRLDWRTGATTITAAIALGALPLRWSEPSHLAIVGAYFVALIVLMATDLDQKLLPDAITVPLAVASAGLLGLMLAGGIVHPLLGGKDLPIVSAIAAGIGAPVLLAATSVLFRGGIGMGDLKLAVGLGLMSGVTRLFSGFLLASAASSFLIIGLVLLRRITLRSAIPFGPVLIVGAMIAALLP